MNPLRIFFESLAEEWDSSQPKHRNKIIIAILLPFDVPLSNARTILDVGCGTGALIPILQLRYPRAKVISIDFAHQMCLRASQRTSAGCVIQCDVHALPFHNTCFDAVICHNSFPHFLEKKQALRNMGRVLNPLGALLILHDLSRDRVNEIHKKAQAEVIHNDLLSESKILAETLAELGFVPETIDETSSHYLIYAIRL